MKKVRRHIGLLRPVHISVADFHAEESTYFFSRYRSNEHRIKLAHVARGPSIFDQFCQRTCVEAMQLFASSRILP